MGGDIFKRLLWQAAFVLILLPINAWGYSEDECVRCHKSGSSESKLQIDIDSYMNSIHAGEISCSDCHDGITGDEHFKAVDLEKVNCLNCHDQENMHGGDEGIGCVDCHIGHDIYGTDDIRSPVNWRNLKVTCGVCHPEQTKNPGILSRLTSFQIVSHPKQDMTMRADRGMCVGCHQGQAAHGEDGNINDQNCYKCHSPADNKGNLLGYIHSYADWQNRPVNIVAGCVSLVALIGVIFILLRNFTGFFSKRRY